MIPEDEEVAVLRRGLTQISHELWQIKCDLAWGRVIKDAIRLSRLVRKYEAAEAAKFNPHWASQPRVPKDSPGGGQWTDGDGNLHLVGGRGPRRPSGGPANPSGSAARFRLRPGNVEIPPNMEVPVQTAFQRAEAAVARAREGNTNWRPKPEASRPKTTPQELIALANRVEVQANAEISRQIGNNGGPPLSEPSLPAQPAPRFSREPFDSNLYRRDLGLPQLQGPAAKSKGEGTVAYAEIDGEIVLGVNSSAPSYTEADREAATLLRDRLLELHPNEFKAENRGQKPNDFVYHGEATLLIRAAQRNGGSLRGKSILIEVDRAMCGSCETGLPLIGLELGNPNVRFRDPYGRIRRMQNGKWQD